jgi:bifunctional non-homologous end joining protein LigD
MPLVVVANSPDRDAALAGLERWKTTHGDIANLIQVDDVLVDSMRGRSSTWTRIRVNLRHVPEQLRPAQEKPDPDYDPAVEWQSRRGSRPERSGND